MAEPSSDTITSLLCSGRWDWDLDHKCAVKFNSVGTGELLCGVEFNVFIASEFDWEMRAKAGDITMASPATFEVAITLTKRDIKDYPRPIKHTALSNAAFEQKVYQLQIQKGSFKVEDRTTYGVNPTYEYRLLWHKSPYPPLEEWDHKRPAAAGRYWERKDFYKGRVRVTE